MFGKVNSSAKLPMNRDKLSNFNDYWTLEDPDATQMIPLHRLQPLLKSIRPPIFENEHESHHEIFKMNINTVLKNGVLHVHYVDVMVGLVRYEFVKAFGEPVGSDIDITLVESPELSNLIVRAYPQLKGIKDLKPTNFKEELAAVKIQNLWFVKRAMERRQEKRQRLELEVARTRGFDVSDSIPIEITEIPAEDLAAEIRIRKAEGRSDFDFTAPPPLPKKEAEPEADTSLI